MFGFLNPGQHSLSYRSLYARCCQLQRQSYGVLSLPWHAYESVFLYCCCVDAKAIDLRNVISQRCCRLTTGAPLGSATDAEVGLFTASVSLLLAKVKLEDDIRDHHSVLARAAQWLLSRRRERAVDYFRTIDGDFTVRLAGILQQQAEMEYERSPGISLEQYSEPTAAACAYLFQLLSRLPHLEGYRQALEAIGRSIGGGMVAFNCALDWRRDRQRGLYNPVKNLNEAWSAAAFAQARLRDAIATSQSAFGASFLTAELLRRVHDNLHKRARKFQDWRRAAEPAVCGQSLPTSTESTMLYATCCVPCGGGAISCNRKECGNCCTNLSCAGCAWLCCCWFCCQACLNNSR